MKANTVTWIARILKYTLLAGAALYLLTYLILACFRLPYPFELEWMEGGAVDHVRRILGGQVLYVQPSLEFIPYIYTPLYFYLSAGLAGITGVGFVPLRLVSIAASIGCFAVIFLLVKRETERPLAGFLACSLFAATYRIGGAWLDIARVDSLFLFLLLLAIYWIRFGTTWRSDIAAGLLLTLAFLTKQSALLIALPLLLYALLTNRRRSLALIATTAVGIGGSTLLLNALHQGWYVYYIFDLPRQHQLLPAVLVTFWAVDLFFPLPLASLAAILYLVGRPAKAVGQARLFYLLVAAGMLAGAWFSRLHFGGYDNVLLPAYVALALLFGLGVHALTGFIRSKDRRTLLEIGIYVTCLAQFALLVYSPAAQVPTTRDRAAGESFIHTVEQIPGEVLIPYHGTLPALAGKRSYAHWMALSDVLRSERGEARDRLSEELKEAIREQRFAAIIVDIPDWLPDLLETHYQRAGPVLAEDAFWPVTGPRIRPEYLYLPRPAIPLEDLQ